MLKTINKYCSSIGFQVIGNGTLAKLKKNEFYKNEFETQKKIILNKNPIIFDIGANRGDITQKYLDLYPNSTIYAFEPFIDNNEIFESRFNKNKNIILNKIALSDKIGKIDFYVNKNSDTNSLLKPKKIESSSDRQCENKSKIQIEVNTLDEFCKNNIYNIDILKLDVQGSELNILKGSYNLLKERKIKLIYTETYFKEQYENQPLFYEIYNYLTNFGYYLEDFYNPYYNSKQILWCDTIFILQ